MELAVLNISGKETGRRLKGKRELEQLELVV
jgi:hypothetical protein